MRLRNKLEQLGKMKGVNQDEKGTQLNSDHNIRSIIVKSSVIF
jgi:hypothetical protein